MNDRVELHHVAYEDVITKMPDGSVDAIISDPPYGNTNLAWDKSLDWDWFWSQAARVLKPTGIVVLFAAQKFTFDLANSNRRWFRYELVWEKSHSTGFLNANRRPLVAHEHILIFAPRLFSTVYNPQKTQGKPYMAGKSTTGARHYHALVKTSRGNPSGLRYPRSVLYFPAERMKGNHPTQKPLALMEWLVLTYTNRGQVVVDPFMGSGTTGEACVKNGRRFIGVEREQDYFSMAWNRILHETRIG